jgi:hypothetical protein
VRVVVVVGSLLWAATNAAAFEVQCGAEGGDAFGWAVASGSDFNGDGTPDMAVSAPCAWVGASAIRAGRVQVFSGKTGAVLLSLAGTDAEQEFGASLAWIPDFDADGRAELVIGSATFPAPKQGGGTILGAGKVEVRSSKGGVLWTVFGATANASFGETLSVVADVTGDGKSEVAVGASGVQIGGLIRGAAYLLNGATGAQLARNDGLEEGDLWGSLVGAAGDVNGDGTADWLSATKVAELPEPLAGVEALVTTTTTTTTTTLPPRAGRLSVLSGKPPYGVLQTYFGASTVDRLGRAAAAAGDTDGDDLGDLWIGSPGAEPSTFDDAGLIGLYSATGETIREITEPVPQQGAVFGTSLVVPGDLDGGDIDDIVAGAPNGRVSGKNLAGRVHAFAAEGGALLWTQSGTLAQERFGQSLASGFDYDGDHVPDLLVGAPGDSPGGKRGAGSAFVLSGKDGTELDSFHGRRGRETRLFFAGPDLAREATVRGFDSSARRREVDVHPFRGQDSTLLSMAVVNGGRREETQNGFKTLLAVGSGRGGSKPEIAVYRVNRRRHLVSRFAAGPVGYVGGINIAAGEFYIDAGDEIIAAPADATGGEVFVSTYEGKFVDPITGRITWVPVRDPFAIFHATDKFGGVSVNADGANLAAGDLAVDSFDEIVAAPAAGLPVVREFGRTGNLIKEWQAYPFPGDGPKPNSGVSVAVGNLDGEGRPEIVTAPASGQPWVAAWNADGSAYEYSPGQQVSFILTQFGDQFGGGLTVTTADVDLDGDAEIIVAPGKGVPAQILAFETNGTPVQGWLPYKPFGPLAIKGLGLCGLDQFWRR